MLGVAVCIDRVDHGDVPIGINAGHAGAVLHVNGDVAGRPLDVVCDFLTGGEERLQINEVREPVIFKQIVEKVKRLRGLRSVAKSLGKAICITASGSSMPGCHAVVGEDSKNRAVSCALSGCASFSSANAAANAMFDGPKPMPMTSKVSVPLVWRMS